MLQIEPSWGFARFTDAVNCDTSVRNMALETKEIASISCNE